MTRLVFPLAHAIASAAQLALLGVVAILYVGATLDTAREELARWRADWGSS